MLSKFDHDAMRLVVFESSEVIVFFSVLRDPGVNDFQNCMVYVSFLSEDTHLIKFLRSFDQKFLREYANRQRRVKHYILGGVIREEMGNMSVIMQNLWDPISDISLYRRPLCGLRD